VTVSIGIAAAPGQAATSDELVRNADKALYLAKRSGKNRVEAFEA
jgi:diguanylate cyclase (GGDEF)-like protein